MYSIRNIRGAYKSENNPELFNFIYNCFRDGITIEYEQIVDEIQRVYEKYKESICKLRIGQGKYRDSLIEKYGCKCMICNIHCKELLIASHIKEFAESTRSESIDLNNGLLLCANHDKLFDRHLISFDKEGKIVISNRIDMEEYKYLNINELLQINTNKEMLKYMSHHRKKLQKK